MPFVNENIDAGLAKDAAYQVGISNVYPPGTPIEAGVKIPTPLDRANWVHYDIALECMLDSGIVVHRRLPQVDQTPDTLASCDIADSNADMLKGLGVNLKSNDTFQDVVQRMAHSQYFFRLYGRAARLGEQIPIPSLKYIAGVAAVPYDTNKQFAYNKIVGNYGGQVLWQAEWSLWYTLASAPKTQQAPPQNLSQHIDATPRPEGMQAPLSIPDDNSVSSRPRSRPG